MNSSPFLFNRRRTFTGRTDFRTASISQTAASLDVSRGVSPETVVGNILGDVFTQDSTTRMVEYTRCWDFFSGRHFPENYDGAIPYCPTNYCSRVVNKRASWAAGKGKGLSLSAEKGNEDVAIYLQKFWAGNRVRRLFRRTALTSLVTGDAFWYVFVSEAKELRIAAINPAFCHPVYREDDPDNMKEIVVQFPAMIKDATSGVTSEKLFTLHVTETEIMRYVSGTLQSREPNKLGMIPFVHIRNGEGENTVFGVSVLRDIIPLNIAHNRVSHAKHRIIAYHGEPTTVVFGASLANIERGAGKLWSGLDKDAKVETLKLETDLNQLQEELNRLETQIYATAKTPHLAYDVEKLAVSNTSGLAMSMMLLPLIEATEEIQSEIFEGVDKVHTIVAKWVSLLSPGYSLESLAADPETALSLTPSVESMLPRDEAAYLDLNLKRYEAGAISKAELIRRVSGVSDTRQLALELAADRVFQMAEATEKARALQGMVATSSFAFLGSAFIHEDLVDTASKIAEITAVEGSDSGSKENTPT